MEALAAVAGEDGGNRDVIGLFVKIVEMGGSVEEAFGAKEVACAGAFVELEAESADQGIG